MSVRFVPLHVQSEWIPVLQFPVNLKRMVRVCPDRVSWRTTELHWDDTLGKTVPCHGQGECPYCPRPIRFTTYCPALEYVFPSRKWLRRIMPFTDTTRSVLDLELTFATFEVERRGRKNAPVRVTRIELPYEPPPVLPFAIEASLYKMWGCQREVVAG